MGGHPAAVLLNGGHIALAVGRSLAEAGVDVYGLGADNDPLRHSRRCRQFVRVGGKAESQGRSLEWLEKAGPRGAVLIPCDDFALELFAQNLDLFREWGYRPIDVDADVVLAMLDKGRTYEIAEASGIETPRVVRVASAEQARGAAERIGYPCALKPLIAHTWAQDLPLHTKALLAHDREEFMQLTERLRSLSGEVMVTEFIPGHDDRCQAHIAFLDERGEPLMEATKRRIRQYRPGFGSSSYTLLEWDPEIAELGLRFLREVGARGPVYVEFKRDPRDDRLKLIECNHRFTGPTALLRRGGVDLAALTYNHTLGIEGPRAGGRRDGIALWSPLLDLRALRAYRRRGQATIPGWLWSLRHFRVLPIADRRDPLPSVTDLLYRIRRWLQKRIPSRRCDDRGDGRG